MAWRAPVYVRTPATRHNIDANNVMRNQIYPAGFDKSKALLRTRFSWTSMIQRCSNPKSANWKYYGGRGISVCEEWKSFSSFVSSMGLRPDGMNLDRINNEGNYDPGNVRWATRKQQQRNTRKNRFITFRGITCTIAEMAERFSTYPRQLVRTRIHIGWTVEKALYYPVRHYSKRLK